MSFQGHFQNAYVTHDLERAMELAGRSLGLGDFFPARSKAEDRDSPACFWMRGRAWVTTSSSFSQPLRDGRCWAGPKDSLPRMWRQNSFCNGEMR